MLPLLTCGKDVMKRNGVSGKVSWSRKQERKIITESYQDSSGCVLVCLFLIC